MKALFLPLVGAFFSLLATSCMREAYDDLEQPVPSPGGEVVYIMNRGTPGAANSSLSYYLPDKKKVVNNVFFRNNNMPLGDTGTGPKIKNGWGYITLGRSSRATVIDMATFKQVGKISGVLYPTSVHVVNDKKAYLIPSLDKKITIFHPKTLNITGKISLPDAPYTGKMVPYGDRLVIATIRLSSSGDKVPLLFIDPETDKITDSINVDNYGRNMVIDKNDKIWLIHGSFGKKLPIGPSLSRINPKTLKVEKSFPLPESPESVTWQLALNPEKDTLYWEIDTLGLWRMPVIEDNVPSKPFIPAEKGQYFSALGIAKNGDIYIGDGLDRKQAGVMYRYRKEGGEPFDSAKIGVRPHCFVFEK